jgi:hypothetical protein
MKNTDDLFLLIKSLTRTEKRYFKLSTKGNSSENEFNYLNLFNIIDKQNNYDETKVIISYFKNREIKNFPNEKRHLYNLILKSLNKYHSTITKENELNELLNSAQILNKKQLQEQCNKLLNKLTLFAEKHELYTGLIKIGELRSEIIVQKANSSINMKEEFESIRHYSNLAIERLIIENKFNILFTQLLEKIRKDGEVLRHPSEKKWFINFMSNPLLENEDQASTFKSKSIFYFINGTTNYIIGNIDKAVHFYKKDIEHLEKESENTTVDPSLYSAKISNLCLVFLKKKDYNSLAYYREKLKNTVTHFPMEKSKLFYRYYDLLIKQHVLSGDFILAIETYKSIEEEMREHINNIHKSRIISFNYSIAYSYLALSNFKEAKIWVNKLLDEKTNYRNDLLCISRILDCIIQLEIGNENSLVSSLRATSYFMKKSDKIYQFEVLFLKFFTKILKETIPSKRTELMMAFKNELSLLKENPYETEFLNYFDLISWLESKITGVSFVEIIKNKNS